MSDVPLRSADMWGLFTRSGRLISVHGRRREAIDYCTRSLTGRSWRSSKYRFGVQVRRVVVMPAIECIDRNGARP